MILGVTFMTIMTFSLMNQKRQMENKLVAARLCKETLSTGNFASSGSYRVHRNSSGISVLLGNQHLLSIRKL